jgi:hypothetical protein
MREVGMDGWDGWMDGWVDVWMAVVVVVDAGGDERSHSAQGQGRVAPGVQ